MCKEDDEPEWIVANARKEKRAQVVRRREELERRLEKARREEAKALQQYHNGEGNRKRRVRAPCNYIA